MRRRRSWRISATMVIVVIGVLAAWVLSSPARRTAPAPSGGTSSGRTNQSTSTAPPSPDELIPTSTGPTSTTNPRARGGCIISGCNGEVCHETEQVTICEWRDSYACYQTAPCEQQADERCGWTPTVDLIACLSDTGP